MKKSDWFVVGFMYGVCILFFIMALSLKKEAQTYPIFIIVLLFLLTSGYLVKMLVSAKKHGVSSGFKEIFAEFAPAQFFIILGMIAGYLILMYLAGFYIATIGLLVGCLLFLKVPKWQILVTSVVIIGLVYGAFTMFLGVKLPRGLIFT